MTRPTPFAQTRIIRATLFLGDVVIFVVFAALGRSQHGQTLTEPVVSVLLTAWPFIVGWTVGGVIGGAFRTEVLNWRRMPAIVLRSWLVGAAIGLGLHSFAVGHLAPLPFILVAFAFNLILLLGWRFTADAVLPHLGGLTADKL